VEACCELRNQRDSTTRERARSDTVTGLAWYVTYTCPRHEKSVFKHLKDRGISSCLPTYVSGRRWKDRRKVLEMPLFPGYVFVHMNAENRIEVLRVPGIRGFIVFQGRPARVETVEMENLQLSLLGPMRVLPHPFLKSGRRVRIRSGAMTGVEGILLRMRDQTRLVLSVTLLRRSVSVEVDATDVEPIC